MSIADSIKTLARRSPIHPQWLLGVRKPCPEIGELLGTVLDVGCASRWIEPHLSPGASYIGLDYPPTGSTLYSAKADVLADAAMLPFATSTIDAVICLEVLEHANTYIPALNEIFRVLKPNGTLLLSMPFLYPIHDAPHDYQRLTEYGLRRDIARAGFEIRALRKKGHSIRTAGLLFNLALSGGLYNRRSVSDYFLLPFVAILVFIVNLVSVSLAWALPDWEAMSYGYEIKAVKP